jgi:hypothetical protein
MLMSSSQFKMLLGCMRRWGFRHLDKKKEEMGEAAKMGDAYHYEMEMWCKVRRMPTTRPALAALRYAPAPGVAEAEVAIRYDHEGAGWIGFVDLCYNWEGELGIDKGKILPLAPDGHTVIHDWKFTGNLSNAMDEHELLTDVAANLYALEAYAGGARMVSCRWVYVQMKGSPTTREVWVEMPLQHVLDCLDKMSKRVVESNQLVKLHKKGELKVLDLETNTSHCFDFRRECIYKPECNPISRMRMPAPKGEPMNDFMKHLSNLPGLPSVPAKPAVPAVPSKLPTVPLKPSMPAVPVKAPSVPAKAVVPLAEPAAPVVPNKDTDDLSDEEANELVAHHLKAQGKDPSFATAPGPVVERGHVNNPAYAPEVPAASPEEAKEQQASALAAEAPKVETDDLTEMTFDQLKGLAQHMGLIKPRSRPREDTLRGLIRAERIKTAAGAAPAAQAVQEPETTDQWDREQQAYEAEKQARIEAELASEATILSKEAQDAVRAEVARVEDALLQAAADARFAFAPNAGSLEAIKAAAKLAAPVGVDVKVVEVEPEVVQVTVDGGVRVLGFNEEFQGKAVAALLELESYFQQMAKSYDDKASLARWECDCHVARGGRTAMEHAAKMVRASIEDIAI